MKPRWPLKQTVPIRWSAPAWRPQINFGAANQPERPNTIRVARPQQAVIELNGNDADEARMWI
jgi:hypothetical protein